MSWLFALVVCIGLGTGVAVGLAELAIHRRRLATWRRCEVRFGRDVTVDSVTAVLSRIAGLHHGARLVIDVRTDAEGVHHEIATDQATLTTIQGVLRASLPSLRLIDLPADGRSYRFGRSVRLRGRLGVLRDDQPGESTAGLIAALQPIGTGEALLLRWVLKPGQAHRVPSVQYESDGLPTDDRRLLRKKNENPIIEARCLLAVDAGAAGRACHLMGRVMSVLRARSTAYGFLQAMPRSSTAVRRLLARNSFWRWDRYAAGELAGLIGWPIEAPALPGLKLGTSPMRMPAERLPRQGRVLGTSTWPGSERPVAQPIRGALSHSLVAGPTGVGKSTLLTHLIEQDLDGGRGVVLIDGKGDTVDDVLARVPNGRRGDVFVLDCASDAALPGVSLFGAGDPELAADVVLSVLADLFKDSWGPLSERYLRAGLVAVAHDEAGTLADVPFVFSDATYRRRLTGKIRDPLTRATLATYEGMSAAERAQQLAAPLGKLGQLLSRPVVRTVLGQSRPKLNFNHVLSSSRVVLVSLDPTRIGSRASRLMGAVVVFALFQAVRARGRTPSHQRRPFMVYIDEPKVLGDLPMPLDALLEQARGLGVGVTLAPQSLQQLTKSLREAVLSNVATRVIFTQNADDARVLARDLAGVAQEDLQDLGAFEVMARLGLGPGDTAAPVTLTTASPSQPRNDAATLRAESASRYGMGLAAVDRELESRHQQSTTGDDATPIGRVRRQP